MCHKTAGKKDKNKNRKRKNGPRTETSHQQAQRAEYTFNTYGVRGGGTSGQFYGNARRMSLGLCGLCGLLQGEDPSGGGEHSLYLCQAAHLKGDAKRDGYVGPITQTQKGRDHTPGRQSPEGWEALDKLVVAACPECHKWWDRHFGGKVYDSSKKELYAGYREGMR
jgi:hypothetical protein